MQAVDKKAIAFQSTLPHGSDKDLGLSDDGLP